MLVTYFSILSSFTYFLSLIVQAEKEGMTVKTQRYFQTQLLFSSLQLFRGVECFSRTSKIAVFLVEVSIGIWGFSFFGARKPIFSGMHRFPFLLEASFLYLFYFRDHLFVFILFFVYFYCKFLMLLLWEPYPSHHNGLFSPLLVLRDSLPERQINSGVIRTVRDFFPFLCNSIFLV